MGQHLKHAREHLGLTQAQVGQMIGRDQSAISKYENGAKPDLDVVSRLATALQMTREEVLFGPPPAGEVRDAT